MLVKNDYTRLINSALLLNNVVQQLKMYSGEFYDC